MRQTEEKPGVARLGARGFGLELIMRGAVANTDITQPVSSSNESLQFSGEQVAGADTRKCLELGPCSSAQGD